MYLKSLDATIADYKKRLAELRANDLRLQNVNFDTGEPTHAAQYKLTDDSYAYWLGKLEERRFDMLTPGLRNDVLAFYGNLGAAIDTKRHKDDWDKLQARLEELKRAHTLNPESLTAQEGVTYRRDKWGSAVSPDSLVRPRERRIPWPP